MQPGGADMRYCVCAAEVQSTHVTHQLLWHNSFLHYIKLSHTSHYLQVITLHDLLHQPPSCDMSILSHTSPPHQLQAITTQGLPVSVTFLYSGMSMLSHTSPPHQLQAITTHGLPVSVTFLYSSMPMLSNISPPHQHQAITLHDLPALATFL